MNETVLMLSLLSSSLQPIDLELLLDREARTEVEFETRTEARWSVTAEPFIVFEGEVGGVRASTGSHYVGFARWTVVPQIQLRDQGATRDGLIKSLRFSAKSAQPELLYELILQTPWTVEQSRRMRRGVSLQARFRAPAVKGPIEILAEDLKVVSWGSELEFSGDDHLRGPIIRLGIQVSRGSRGDQGRQSAEIFPFQLSLEPILSLTSTNGEVSQSPF